MCDTNQFSSHTSLAVKTNIRTLTFVINPTDVSPRSNIRGGVGGEPPHGSNPLVKIVRGIGGAQLPFIILKVFGK